MASFRITPTSRVHHTGKEWHAPIPWRSGPHCWTCHANQSGTSIEAEASASPQAASRPFEAKPVRVSTAVSRTFRERPFPRPPFCARSAYTELVRRIGAENTALTVNRQVYSDSVSLGRRGLVLPLLQPARKRPDERQGEHAERHDREGPEDPVRALA